jgi:uncharacterized protein (TIGR03032 family)
LNTRSDTPAPLSSVHTTNFPELLERLRCSFLVTTFQANKLILVRAQQGRLNTHFHHFNRPMGLAADLNRIFVGSQRAVHEFRNVPAVAAKLGGDSAHDAVYLPRNTHVTGHVDIHEMAFSENACWYVNTLFSCLCTLDTEHSFVPCWRPRFISAYAPEDRCHLNGLAVDGGKPRFLTALGSTDLPEGWRADKRDGGVLIEFESREIVARGLSMPHSPRIHDGRLWLLESGKGSLVTIDPDDGKAVTAAKLPGFTRGLDFIGNLAFVGLSQLRSSNPFTDIPLTDQNPERASGVWVVDILTGRTVAFLRFSAAVEEIFAVRVLPGLANPHLLDDADPLLDSTWSIPDAMLAEFAHPRKTG